MAYRSPITLPPILRDLTCSVRATTVERTTLHFTSVGALEGIAPNLYDSILTLEIRNIPQQEHYDYIGSIEHLPMNLQSLSIIDCNGLKKFPRCLPVTIHTVVIRNTRVRDIPNIAHLTALESLDMYGSSVDEVVNPMPPGLRTLDLRFNCLKRIDHRVLPPDLNANFSNNQITNFDRGGGVEGDRHRFHNNAGMNQREYVDREILVGMRKNVYGDSQNVHDTTVQTSVRRSIDALFRDSEINSDIYTTVTRLSKKLDLPWVNDLQRDTTTIGTTALTICDLLARAYEVASNHESKDDLFQRLKEELIEGQLLCFTGKVSRIINAFCGFVPGVEVMISARDQLQIRVGILLKKKFKNYNEALEELLELISTSCISEEEFNAWLEAFEDFEEERIPPRVVF
jgi:hypothetical protein